MSNINSNQFHWKLHLTRSAITAPPVTFTLTAYICSVLVTRQNTQFKRMEQFMFRAGMVGSKTMHSNNQIKNPRKSSSTYKNMLTYFKLFIYLSNIYLFSSWGNILLSWLSKQWNQNGYHDTPQLVWHGSVHLTFS